MTARNQNFAMHAGDTKHVIVTVTGVDLAGAAVKWSMRKAALKVAGPGVSKDTNAGIEITNAATGEFTIKLNPTDTAGMSGTYLHEAEVTDAAGNVSTVLTGMVTIHRKG